MSSDSICIISTLASLFTSTVIINLTSSPGSPWYLIRSSIDIYRHLLRYISRIICITLTSLLIRVDLYLIHDHLSPRYCVLNPCKYLNGFHNTLLIINWPLLLVKLPHYSNLAHVRVRYIIEPPQPVLYSLPTPFTFY